VSVLELDDRLEVRRKEAVLEDAGEVGHFSWTRRPDSTAKHRQRNVRRAPAVCNGRITIGSPGGIVTRIVIVECASVSLTAIGRYTAGAEPTHHADSAPRCSASCLPPPIRRVMSRAG
jgi:hypothetical protein